MATDYATSPVTLNGQLLYGAGCGALTVLIRYFGGFPEGRDLRNTHYEPVHLGH
ncbi:MAG: RnfABCDGE type electron transport complex subunit D [Oscillospiraceae bacterium]